jgi:lipopolysaccharide export system protein LptC
VLPQRPISNYVALLALAGGTWWLADYLTPKEAPAEKLSRGKVDYYSTHISRTVMTPEGIPKSLLYAVTMTHYKGSDRTEMEKPVMTLYKPGASPWIIHSDTATSLSGGSAVYLNGDVLITRETNQGDIVKIITRDVKYDPDKNYAETAEYATILGPGDKLSGTGMQVYFEPDLRANLLADVRRTHEMHPKDSKVRKR